MDESLQAFARVDMVNTRKQLNLSRYYRSVVFGSFLSTAARWSGFNEADLTGAENCCPMCAAALGTHQHTFWECPQNPIPTGRPPDNPLQLRYGWFILDGDSDSNQLYCGHMTATASRRLQLRHDGAED